MEIRGSSRSGQASRVNRIYGLGTCWIGSFDQDACCNVLDVPATAKIVQMLVIGYPDGDQGQRPRKTLEEVVCYDKFS